MLKSDPIQEGDFAIVVKGDYKGQAVIINDVVKFLMAHVYFPMLDIQKTLRLTSLHNRHPLIAKHSAFAGCERGTPSKASTSTGSSSPSIQILPPSVDAAIVALCAALDAAHMEAGDSFVAHVDSRLRSSRRSS
jgi:hypothetical protein